MRGVADYANGHGWNLDCRMHWTHDMEACAAWQGHGIISYIGVSEHMQRSSRPLMEFVRSRHVPVVELQPFIRHFGGAQVVVHDESVGRAAADYFLTRGFQHFGYVAFDENLIEAHRRESFRRAVEQAGRHCHLLTAGSLASRLAHLPRPMALFAMNDLNALHVIRACREAGCHVPDDFAVLGVDDNEIVCDLAPAPLSSVNCNLEQIGYQAALLLDGMMRGERPPAGTVFISPLGVTERRSTQTQVASRSDVAQVLRALHDRFRENRSVQEILRDTGISIRRVHTPFCRQVGRTMLQELTRLRVDHARRLLADRRLKLETVAWESGFSNRFHFLSVFRRVTGETPTAYRRALASGAAGSLKPLAETASDPPSSQSSG